MQKTEDRSAVVLATAGYSRVPFAQFVFQISQIGVLNEPRISATTVTRWRPAGRGRDINVGAQPWALQSDSQGRCPPIEVRHPRSGVRVHPPDEDHGGLETRKKREKRRGRRRREARTEIVANSCKQNEWGATTGVAIQRGTTGERGVLKRPYRRGWGF